MTSKSLPVSTVGAALVASAERWARDALTAWHDEDLEAVCLMAPQAVELLGKAALWARNPALLAVVSGNDGEQSLRRLVKGDPLSAPGLKTASLSVVLSRLADLNAGFPVEKKRRDRIAAVRNGAVHVGAASEEARHVLLDCLAVIDFLLEQLGRDRNAFYGSDVATVNALAEDQQASVSTTVQMKLAKARNRLRRLEDLLGQPSFDTTTSQRERERFTLDPKDYVPGGTSMDADCPECASSGRLFGYVDVEAEVDWDVEPLGGGQYEPIAIGYWQPSFDPMVFFCAVCELVLDGQEELSTAGLPARRFDVDPSALDDPAFDFETFVAASRYDDET
ncbi:hypothetical protein [Agromyces laixinhei]|uniref:hypothetical protein n=1 Tax=Agromyces laixinhei TaxID=2585717 RepID=UPI001F3945F9|nr:hypothetical protein [Agromyces laixinhei]